MPDAPFTRPETPGWLERHVAWLKARERAILLWGVGLQLLVLVGAIVVRAMPHVTGEAVLLRVVPVDPRDLFRGDYVTLGYEFSRVPPQGIVGLGPRRHGYERDWHGRTVYVTLVPEPDGRHWSAERFSTSPPADGKYLRGTIVGGDRIEYGIESYYVQEGQGKEYEQAVFSRRLSAEVSIAPNGQAGLKGLRIE